MNISVNPYPPGFAAVSLHNGHIQVFSPILSLPRISTLAATCQITLIPALNPFTPLPKITHPNNIYYRRTGPIIPANHFVKRIAIMPAQPVINNFFAWIEQRSTHKKYPFYLTLVLVCSSLFLAFPRYDLYRNTTAWDVTMLKSKDLTNNLQQIPPASYLAKKVFRLTVPVIIRIFHLNRIGVLVIQFMLGMLSICLTYLLGLRVLRDGVAATFLAAGFAFLYCGRTCFTEITYTWFDGWAYFFLLMALYSKNKFAVFAFATMAAWTDERAFVALPLALLFHQVCKLHSPLATPYPPVLPQPSPAPTYSSQLTTQNSQLITHSSQLTCHNSRRLLALQPAAIAVLAAMIGYLALRLYLSVRFNMHTPHADANTSNFLANMIHTSFGFGAFTFLEGFWLMAPIFLYLNFKNKDYLLMALTVFQILLSSLVSLFVMDITRSGSYLFPIIFLFAAYIPRFLETWHCRMLLAVCLFFCLIFPPINYIAFGDFLFRIEKPFLWVLMSLIYGHCS